MRFLSVAERELRVTARRTWFYRARAFTALAFFGLLVWLAWVYDLHKNRRAAADVFEAYSIFVFIYCLLVGTASTADCLSREKREGTLGLLFLTNLNSAEITAGKICSSSLTLLYSLLAIFPLLALPVLFGGITVGDFWFSVLGLINTLWFAMAAGFVASALCVRQFPAVAVATGLALFFGVAWLGIMELLRHLGWPLEVTNLLGSFSPLKTLELAGRNRSLFARSDYWNSLIAVAAVSTLVMLLVSWWIARTWQDRPKRARAGFWPGSKRLETGISPTRVALRRRLLSINPFLWLGSRQRVSAPVFMIISVLMILTTVLATGPFFSSIVPAGAIKPVVGNVIAWLWTGLAIHVLTLYYAAAAASQRLAEDRQTGALELILATPTNERIISRGLWLAYWRRMFFPVLLATLVHGYFIWQGAFLFTLEPIEHLPAHTTPNELLWAALTGGLLRGTTLHWAYGFILRIFLLAWVLFAIAWVTLGWVGRWLGLRMKRPGFAPLVALGLTIVPPVLLFSLACYIAVEWKLNQLPEQLFLPLMMWLGFGIGAAHCLALSLWAAAHLRESFRLIVTGRDLPESRRARWRTNRRLVFRIAGVLILLALLGGAGGFLHVANQNSQSRNRWAAFQKAHGGTPKLAAIFPPSVPAAQNFVASPAFQAVLHQKPQDKSALAMASNVIKSPAGFVFNYNPNDPTVSWIRQSPLNFDEQLTGQKFAASSTNAATAVLERLAALRPELDALAVAAVERTNFMTPAPRDRTGVFDTKSQELQVLESLHGYFQLRACARIDTGDLAGAANDALTTLRLTRLAAQSIDQNAAARAQLLAGRSIQPIWEGLVRHAWSETQLTGFQTELSELKLLAVYTNNIRRVVLAQIELWEQFGNTPATRPLVGANFVRDRDRWQPRGWWLDCAIELHDIGADILANVNAESGWMREPDNQRGLYELPLEGETQQLLQQARWWGNNFSLTAFAQTSVNEAIVACALERHRFGHGHYPDSLDELVPTLLPRIPTDILRGRPLLYQENGDTYTLHGVGPNLRDDRDKTVSDDWVWSFGTNTPAAK